MAASRFGKRFAITLTGYIEFVRQFFRVEKNQTENVADVCSFQLKYEL